MYGLVSSSPEALVPDGAWAAVGSAGLARRPREHPLLTRPLSTRNFTHTRTHTHTHPRPPAADPRRRASPLLSSYPSPRPLLPAIAFLTPDPRPVRRPRQARAARDRRQIAAAAAAAWRAGSGPVAGVEGLELREREEHVGRRKLSADGKLAARPTVYSVLVKEVEEGSAVQVAGVCARAG